MSETIFPLHLNRKVASDFCTLVLVILGGATKCFLKSIQHGYVMHGLCAVFFSCLRYTQPPADLIEWYDGFLDDEEVCHLG